MLKKTFIFIFIIMLLSINVSAADYEELIYSIDDEGFVTIEGIARLVSRIEIPDEIYGHPVKYIRESAFANSIDLFEMKISDNVVQIGREAFNSCVNLKSVKLPANLERIEFGTFRGCGMLNSITLPSTLKFIDDFAFEGCIRLKELKIPASVEYVGHDVFMTCESLRLDCSENSYAAGYAEQYSIPTSFKTSWDYTLMVVLIITVVLGGCVFIVFYIFGKMRKRRKAS